MPAIANPCCCGKCVVFKDDFSHPFERINGNDSTGNWIGLPNLSTEPGPPESCWEWGGIGFYLLCGNHFSSDTPQFIWRGNAPRHVSATLGIVPANVEQEFSLTYGADDGTNVKRYRVKITISDESRYSLDEHYTATPTHCGKISLWDATDVTALVRLSIDVPVPGLCALTGSGTSPPPGVEHLLTLCYDPETQVLSAHVAVYLGDVHALHALNCATPADPLIGSGLSFEVDNFNGADQGAVFTSFTVKQTINLPDGYGYGYGYDGTDVEDCPCCGPRGCQSSSIDVAADPLDCRLHVSSGSISQASDVDGAYLRLANNTKIQWLSSWSGLDEDCLPDRTFYLTFALRINAFAMFANVELAWLDSTHRIWASILSETSAGANGTLSIFQSDGTLIDIATLTGDIKGQWVTVTVCYDGFTLTASALGETVEGESDDPGGQFIGFKSNNTRFFDTFDIKDVTLSHNIYSPDCPDCAITITGCTNCIDEHQPEHLRARISGVGPGSPTDCLPAGTEGFDCAGWNHANASWIVAAPATVDSIHRCLNTLADFDSGDVVSCDWVLLVGDIGSDPPPCDGFPAHFWQICREFFDAGPGDPGCKVTTQVSVSLIHNNTTGKWAIVGMLITGSGVGGIDPSDPEKNVTIRWLATLPDGFDPIDCFIVLDDLELPFYDQCTPCAAGQLLDASGSTMRLAVA